MNPLITKFIEPQPSPYSDLHHPHDRRQFGGCLLACGVLLSFTSCATTATACKCSVLNADPVKIDICAGCMAIFFPAAGADLILAAGYCKGGNGPVGALARCSAQCSPLLKGYGTCPNESCLCPTVSTAGVSCSQCLAGINTNDASVVGSLINYCAGTGNTMLMTTPVGGTSTPVVVVTSASSSTAAPVSGQATSPSHSGAHGLSIGFVGHYFNYLILVAIVIGIVEAVVL